MTDKNFGTKEGIGKRLAYWANQLSRDKSYPWVGTGLIDDLKCAANMHGATFDDLYPFEVISPLVSFEDEYPPAPVVEFDL